MTFVLVERPRHAVGLNAAYSSDLGASAGATWTDRNAFGNAEQLAINAGVFNLGATARRAMVWAMTTGATAHQAGLPQEPTNRCSSAWPR